MKVSKLYIAQTLDEEIKKLLGTALEKLQLEFQYLLEKTDWAKKWLFEYNERAFVGLFNNAIVRHTDEYITFQEYHVYKDTEQLIGRGDLLIIHNDFDFLIEAKKWDYDGKDNEDMSELFAEPEQQVKAYYEAEKKFFKKKKTYLGVLIFEYVSAKHIKELSKQYNKTSKQEKGVDFDVIYETEKDGLMVYGHVLPASDGVK